MNPLLAPVGSVVLVLVVTGQETIAWDTKGVPPPLWLGLNICGLISTPVLAFYEYRHLRSSAIGSAADRTRFLRSRPHRGVRAVRPSRRTGPLEAPVRGLDKELPYWLAHRSR
jgi:hypothetical protein